MQGNKKVRPERKLYVGFAQSRVVGINPTNAELAELLGTEVDESREEIEYTKDKDGVKQVRIDFWMEEMTTNYLYKRSFFLEDRDVVTKPKEGREDEFVEKKQYVNQTGDSFYTDDADELPDYFTKFQKNTSKTDKTKIVYGDKAYRVAKVGEADLLAFIKVWLYELDYWDVDTSILLDTKKLFKGNFKELQEQVGGDLEASVVDPLGVKIDSKDGEEKQYQDVYKQALPGYLIKTIKNLKITPAIIEKWRAEKKDKNTNPSGRYLKDYEQLIVDITDRTYPWSREYVLEFFQEFNPEKSFAMSGAAIAHDESDGDY